MYIGNDMIEAVSVDAALLSVPGYLGNFKRQLKHKHQSLLQESMQQPEFLVIDLTPANTKTPSTTSRNHTSTGAYYQ